MNSNNMDKIFVGVIAVIFFTWVGFSYYTLFAWPLTPRVPKTFDYISYALFPFIAFAVYFMFHIKLGSLKQSCPTCYVLIVFIGFVSVMASLIADFAKVYLMFGFICHSDTHQGGVADSAFYLSAVTWTNLGYSDCEPTSYSRFFAGVESLIGFLFLAIFVGYFASIFNLVSKED